MAYVPKSLYNKNELNMELWEREEGRRDTTHSPFGGCFSLPLKSSLQTELQRACKPQPQPPWWHAFSVMPDFILVAI